MAVLRSLPGSGQGEPLVIDLPEQTVFVQSGGARAPEALIQAEPAEDTVAVLAWLTEYGGRRVLFSTPEQHRVTVNGAAQLAVNMLNGSILRVGDLALVLEEVVRMMVV
jgi:hypothetical protein